MKINSLIAKHSTVTKMQANFVCHKPISCLAERSRLCRYIALKVNQEVNYNCSLIKAANTSKCSSACPVIRSS